MGWLRSIPAETLMGWVRTFLANLEQMVFQHHTTGTASERCLDYRARQGDTGAMVVSQLPPLYLITTTL